LDTTGLLTETKLNVVFGERDLAVVEVVPPVTPGLLVRRDLGSGPPGAGTDWR